MRGETVKHVNVYNSLNCKILYLIHRSNYSPILELSHCSNVEIIIFKVEKQPFFSPSTAENLNTFEVLKNMPPIFGLKSSIDVKRLVASL